MHIIKYAKKLSRIGKESATNTKIRSYDLLFYSKLLIHSNGRLGLYDSFVYLFMRPILYNTFVAGVNYNARRQTPALQH